MDWMSCVWIDFYIVDVEVEEIKRPIIRHFIKLFNEGNIFNIL